MKRIALYILLLNISAACKERFALPYTGPASGYLVVDGVINSGQGPTTIRLNRTVALVDSINIRYEGNARVRVEGEDNSVYQLVELAPGTYTTPQLNLNNQVRYRLRIETLDGKVYLSEYRLPKRTPEIDSIQWERIPEGVDFFVNTHDPENKTLYYRWEYEETWEFHSAFQSSLQFVPDGIGGVSGVEPRDQVSREKMYRCWKSENSTSILIGTSAKLSRDTIHLPFNRIPEPSWKISVLYSVLLRQYAMSREGYDFLQRMKKNTEQVGTLFDAQPSEMIGNMVCESNPGEVVIGFVEVAEAKEKRIFVRNSEVRPWPFSMGCEEIEVANHADSLTEVQYMVPTDVSQLSFLGDTLSIFVTYPVCGDCTLRGTNVKPSFWP